jgi:hypothetical protein
MKAISNSDTTQVIVRHRICLQTDMVKPVYPPYNFVAGGIIMIISYRLSMSIIGKIIKKQINKQNSYLLLAFLQSGSVPELDMHESKHFLQGQFVQCTCTWSISPFPAVRWNILAMSSYINWEISDGYKSTMDWCSVYSTPQALPKYIYFSNHLQWN